MREEQKIVILVEEEGGILVFSINKRVANRLITKYLNSWAIYLKDDFSNDHFVNEFFFGFLL